MTITTEFSIWLIFFCLLFGIACAAFLYRNKKSEFPPGLRLVLAFLRFALVSLLSFFLLNPMLKTLLKEVEKPVVVFAQDNSGSLVCGKDSSFFRNEYKEELNRLVGELSSKYDVKTLSFGEKVSDGFSFDYTEKQTDISEMMEEVYTLYGNRNLGAVFIATDGIFNKGSNPVFASSKIKAPFYTIALGDTSVKRDLVLKLVRYNRVAYLGNKFPLELVIEAHQLKGQNTKIEVVKGKEVLFSKVLEISANTFFTSVPLQLEASQKGIHHYSVRLSVLEGEAVLSNNSSEVFVEVLDNRQKILVVANTPHPDIRAIRETIEESEFYEVEVFLLSDFRPSLLKNYNLVILHQIPSVRNAGNSLLQEIAVQNIPALFILGSESEFGVFNNLQTGLTLNGTRGKTNECLPVFNKNFVLFTMSEESVSFFRNVPPLISPFGSYKLSSAAQVLFFQKIGMVETGQPLIFFNSFSARKMAVIAGEGIWQWRLNDFARNGSHQAFNDFILKTVQFLSLKENKSRFRVFGRNNYPENEQMVFDAELYNESFELINEPEVNFEIISEEDKKFDFVFSKAGKTYHLNGGILPVGHYRYEARTKVGDEVLSSRGEFSVSAIQVETASMVADHQMLFNLAKRNGGEMLAPAQLKDIPGLLENRKDLVSVSYVHEKLSDFIHVKWILFLLLALLSTEWFIRKRSGSY